MGFSTNSSNGFIVSLRISTVNVTKSADVVTFIEEILNGKLYFLCIVRKTYLGHYQTSVTELSLWK